MSNSLEITLAEKQIIHAWIDDETLFKDDETLFITEIAIEFHSIFYDLKEEGLSFIPEHILKKAFELVDERAIKAVLDTSYQKDKLDVYYRELLINQNLLKIENEVLSSLTKEINKKGPKDIQALSALGNELNNLLSSISDGKNEPLTFYDALEKHEPTLEQRANSIKQHSGCYMLDKLLPHIVPGVCTIGGYSGSMKSTLIHYILKQRIAKRLPTIMVNTELAFSGLMDSLISSMIKEPYYDILGISEKEDMIDFNGIMEKYDGLMKRFFKNDTFRLWPSSSCSIADLKKFILDSRKKMNLLENTTLFVLVDLMSMIKDFTQEGGKTKADTIEDGVNILNEVGLETNSLIIGTVQLKRQDPVKRIEKEEDIEKFRPTLATIKSSGAWEERSRFVILLHNPYHIVHKTPCNPVIKDLINPILEATMMKDTYVGKTGDTIKFYFDAPTKSLYPYEEELEENT